MVEVRISRTHKHMRAEIKRFEGRGENTDTYFDTEGLVRTYYSLRSGHQITRPAACGRVVARMFLNVPSLRKRPSEIVAHECAHAGMAWARHCRANLKVMPGEEILCYAVGEMVGQLNRVCYAHQVWT